MLRRQLPLQPDGSVNRFDLPEDYTGGDVTIFVNGQLLATRDIEDHVYGFEVKLDDEDNVYFLEFYTVLEDEEHLYVLYDGEGDGNFAGEGTISVEANVWQLIALPLENQVWLDGKMQKSDEQSTIKNCVVDQLEDVYDRPAEELFKVANCAIGDEGGQLRNYIPGFTKDTSVHNFPLVYIDDNGDTTSKEIVGFWIRSLEEFIITWKV